ncbi:hypothetical protein [Hyunsoonleella aestuarii]|uniref:Intradiol ring-cleavage dioxygenases domain-containing protein n=1 Tax=Hyunsoonleella aestuarii TaxID=912802 RepID=A0ABP8EDJ5_9FLAO|nr:hypothetical protein [Hyunsoonleella aestuarii]
MKIFGVLFCFVFALNVSTSLNAQDAYLLDEVPLNYKKRSPIYDYTEKNLNNTDTIPDFERRSSKLKITGTIYQSDGVTPAKDIILYIYQPDESGNYVSKKKKGKRYVNHRGWVKTDTNGKYTFYAFVPGNAIEPLTYPRKMGPKQIHPIIKEPGIPEYSLDAFMFDEDPYLTDRCRKKLERIGYTGIVKLDKEQGLFVANRDIILKQNIYSYK